MWNHNILQDSVALTLVNGSNRVDRTAVIGAIGNIVPIDDIESFGNLGDINKWFIIFKTSNSKENFLKLEHIQVNDQKFTIHKPYREVKLIRLLNIPTTISDDKIKEIASMWGGTVINVDCERLPPPYSSIKTFVRRIRMKFASPKDEERIPISIRISGITVPVLLEDRLKVCYRCKLSGHVKSECTTLKCQICKEIGHDDPACRRTKSYSNVTSTTLSPATTPHGVSTDNKSAPLPTSSQLRTKRCHRCKQSGHTQKYCINVCQETVRNPTQVLNAEIASACSAPTTVDDHDNYMQLDSPQLTTGDVQVAAVVAPSFNDQMNDQGSKSKVTADGCAHEHHPSYQNVTNTLQVQPTRAENDRIKINQSSGDMQAEGYRKYKEAHNWFKRSLNDEQGCKGNDSKKQHLHSPPVMEVNEDEEGEI